jgi:hypothetical protein
MKPDRIWKQLLAVFVCSLLGYVLVFGWIEHHRRKAGPWRATFTRTDGFPAMIVNQLALQLTNISFVFINAAAPTNQPQTVEFAHGRPAPFDLPFGQCVFVDTLFLPGTAVCEIFGHQIQFMPRSLTVDQVERSWQSGEKLLLTNQPSATLPAR